jgi:glutamine---fructose-6-phosphate transaminase (isomerizing)
MCGIVGYVGGGKAQELIFRGLARLEYRGYDSAGIAALKIDAKGGPVRTEVIKAPGKLKELKKIWTAIDFPARVAMGHTRWATHGEANQVNAHPHRSGPITIVHNGIIENHRSLREELEREGFKPLSATDSELFSELVRRAREGGASLLEAVRISFRRVHGASAFVVMDERCPDRLVVVRNGSPLVLGLGKGENFVASDVPAVLESTRTIHYLQDMELAELTDESVRIFGIDGKERPLKVVDIQWSLDSIDKQGYEHYMLKEINEQPRALSDTLGAFLDLSNGRFRLDSVSSPSGSMKAELVLDAFSAATMVHVVACGTAAHAGQYGQQLLEKWAGVPARAELASEFRYRSPVLRNTDVGLLVSQSGETADTLAALKLMKGAGMKVFAVCNVRDSSIPRECDGVFYTNAGIEVGVASTKAFTTQLAILSVLAGAVAAHRGKISRQQEAQWVGELGRIPEQAREVLGRAESVKALAQRYLDKKGFLFLGRGLFFPVALEGALKLKEIAYVHAEGYPAGELKHGPIAMVEPDMLVLAIAPEGQGLLHAKSVSNFEEVKARKGTIFGLVAQGDKEWERLADAKFEIPKSEFPDLLPILTVIPLQLFSYWMAVFKGTEVDQPRNLAKSVTVE